MTFEITNEHAGKTVLSFLRSTIKISSAALAKLKRDEKGILANNAHVTVRYMLRVGDILSVNETDLEDEQSENIIPIDLPLDIIFENDDIMLINKPPYMPTHPSHGHIDDTLANGLAHIYKERNIPFVFRPIGRLDRNTSGISLIAKHSISASYLDYARRNKMISKKYIAILCGNIDVGDEWQTIDTFMKRKEDSIIIRCISSDGEEGSFRAITRWRKIYSNNNISVVEAIPVTGRTHQLRVHFAHIGHSILGDDIYGSASEYISRHALHAQTLSLPIPYSDEIRDFSSPPPSDMQEAFFNICGLSLREICFKKSKL